MIRYNMNLSNKEIIYLILILRYSTSFYLLFYYRLIICCCSLIEKKNKFDIFLKNNFEIKK